jgi:hypothetical protein
MTQVEAAKKEILSHWIAMASLPWAKAQAWRSAKDLAAQYPAEFGDLPKLLEEAMKEKTNAG